MGLVKGGVNPGLSVMMEMDKSHLSLSLLPCLHPLYFGAHSCVIKSDT